MTETPKNIAPQDVAHWQGDLLWPTPLPCAAIIDASAVTAWGVWVFDWLRAHPGIAVIGNQAFRDAVLRCQIPVRWFPQLSDALVGPPAGVSASERAMLWE